MPIFGFNPGVPSNTPNIITDCSNWVPYEAGMEASASAFDIGADAVAAAVTGAVTVDKLDATRRTFAGTATKLYEKTSATAWTDRSVGAGSYTTGSIWSFCQFGDTTLASNYNDAIQQSSSGAFANVTGPKAKIIESVVTSGGGFVFAFNTNDAGYGVSPDRWWCSAINDFSSWVVSTATQCTTGRLLGAGGPVVAAKKFGADSVVAYKGNSMYHGRYVGGSTVWAFQEIPTVGCVGLRGVANLGFAHFIVALDGFYLYDGARPVQIGTTEVRQWFASNITPANASLVEVIYEQDRNRVWVFFPYNGSVLNKALVYHVGSQQWGIVDMSIEAVLVYIGSGVTIDSMSGTMDAQTETYDSTYWTAAARSLAVFNTSHKLCTVNGIPGASHFYSSDMGDAERSSRLTEAYLDYAVRPTSASCSAYASFALGGTEVTGPTQTAYDEIGSSNTPGRFTLRQHARWHRLQFSFTGPCRVTNYRAKINGPTASR